MQVTTSIVKLREMHPRLLWEEAILAAVAMLGERHSSRASPISVQMEDVPGFGTEELALTIDCLGSSAADLAQLRRTYEAPRLVEMAAIAVAGLALYHGGGHEIREVALRGTGADYLVGEEGHLLEVAGRSRANGLEATWKERSERLRRRARCGFYICVVEFETPAARLSFTP